MHINEINSPLNDTNFIDEFVEQRPLVITTKKPVCSSCNKV